MRVLELWRYPVKSMAGERVESTSIDERGLHGDRLWAVRDVQRDEITSAKRQPKLLACSARFVEEPATSVGPDSIPQVTITFPDDSTVRSDAPDVNERLSSFLGKPVLLQALRPASDKAHYRLTKPTADEMRESFAIDPGEPLPDFSMMPMTKLLELGKYATPPGTYFDAMQLHVVTTASLAALRAKSASDFDVRRFRPSIVIEGAPVGFPEAEWTGGSLTIGECTTFVDCPTPRCSMPTRAQEGLPADPKVLKTIVIEAERCLGAYATVTRAGKVRVGDTVRLEAVETSRIGEWARARALGLKRMLIRAAMPK